MESERLVSLDVFRGMTIAGMVVVNNPGTWSAIYSPLAHAVWHGITPTDFIFPFFLFIVGSAIPFSLGKRIKAGGADRAVFAKIIRRTIVIFTLGILLALIPKFDFANLRIPGVLQRIAVCYFFASILFLYLDWKKLAILSAVLLLLYWILMTLVPVPGCITPDINSKVCNLAALLDRVALTEKHMWKQAKVFDPEGILSTIPAIVSTLAGVLAGMRLKRDNPKLEKAFGLLATGICLCALGYIWNYSFPFNKSLWTSSYAVYTGGLALCFLGFCFWVIDIKGYTKWAFPFRVFGMNALALFVLSGFLSKLLILIKIDGGEGKLISLQSAIFKSVYLPLAAPINASLL
ncbi:MAG: DUF5009 domain-containing protein, partial [Acidobacteria bacterium]|nr:DUF5009 domain-containing protein [Acidobacteriota bacterium]